MRRGCSAMFRPAGIGQSLPLEVVVFAEDDQHVLEGILKVPNSSLWFPILRCVPCFLTGKLRPDLSQFCTAYDLPRPADQAERREAIEQAKTNVTFSDKWRRFSRYGLQSDQREFLLEWYCKKLGLPDLDALRAFYGDKRLVLEVGPGSGFNTKFISENCSGQVFSVDISEAAYITYENTKELRNCHVVQADLMDSPFADDQFDFVIADGVLHHTPNTRQSLFALYKKVKPGGQLFFYVYKKMGPARRFCDSFIRENFTRLEPEQCYEACEGLTELGRELSRLNARINLEKGVPVLGIPAGTHDVQRLLYYNFAKCFWNDAFDFETNNMVNFDWYHPHHAWQHTEEEVRQWLEELGVRQFRF
ncbi:MAG: class I SAM-dependent methyltransferase, partial [Pyrinomonadaceae bacterium]